MKYTHMVVALAEDRVSCETAVKIALLSIIKHCHGGDLPIELFYPPADDKFILWLSRYPLVKLRTDPLPGAYGWNVKPQALLTLLKMGYKDIIWIDSDVIAIKDFRPFFTAISPDTIVLTEEALYGGHKDLNAVRARNWGFDVGRTLPFTANTGIIRVTNAHYSLLEKWRELLESDSYKNVQALKWSERPIHMVGDQDVLTALLSSQEYTHIPIQFMRRGKDVIQYFGPYGYTCSERFYNLFYGPPFFAHSQGSKPWIKLGNRPSSWDVRKYFNALYLDVSPYTLLARSYRTEVEEDCSWMQPQFLPSAILRAIGFRYPPFVGMPLAAIADFVRFAKRLWGWARSLRI